MLNQVKEKVVENQYIGNTGSIPVTLYTQHKKKGKIENVGRESISNRSSRKGQMV